MEKRAIIAMSGGVDSSVAAFLIKQAGYDCIGVTMKLFTNDDCNASCKTCCSLSDAEDARSVAVKIGIPYYVFNFTADFKKQVIDRFIYAYENGLTPNPCIDCNRYLKFERLYQRAKELEYPFIVTGHYARIEKRNDRFLLKKAADLNKDQSYVLYTMTQEQLSHTLFPLGDMNKTSVRQIAQQQGFYNAKKPDSQDICFVPDGDYAQFIRTYTKKTYERGYFIDKDGNILGRHDGIINYTIGQRKGLKIAAQKPMYVAKINPVTNQITLAPNDCLLTNTLNAKNFNWIAFEVPPKTLRAKAKVRYRQKECPATITVTGKDTVHVKFDTPQRAITPGQSIVLYDEDIVLGGGIITA